MEHTWLVQLQSNVSDSLLTVGWGLIVYAVCKYGFDLMTWVLEKDDDEW